MFTVALVFMQVIMRYVFHHSLAWSEELARYLFLWQIWLGASYAAKKHAHLKIDAFIDASPLKIQRGLKFISLLLWLGFSLFLAWSGAQLTFLLLKRGQVSPAMRMPMGYAYASVPVGAVLMAIRLIENGVAFFRNENTRKEGA